MSLSAHIIAIQYSFSPAPAVGGVLLLQSSVLLFCHLSRFSCAYLSSLVSPELCSVPVHSGKNRNKKLYTSDKAL